MEPNFTFRGRKCPNKLIMLGAASAMEERGKQIQAAARKIREHMSQFNGEELMDSVSARDGNMPEAMASIFYNLRGIHVLFDKIAGEIQ